MTGFAVTGSRPQPRSTLRRGRPGGASLGVCRGGRKEGLEQPHPGRHEVVRISRSLSMDLITGGGLDAALSGVDVVVDPTSHEAADRDAAVAYLRTATRNLPAAEIRADVRHHVLLTIVGADRVRGRPHRADHLRGVARERSADQPGQHVLAAGVSRVVDSAVRSRVAQLRGWPESRTLEWPLIRSVERHPGARIVEDGAAARAARRPPGRGGRSADVITAGSPLPDRSPGPDFVASSPHRVWSRSSRLIGSCGCLWGAQRWAAPTSRTSAVRTTARVIAVVTGAPRTRRFAGRCL
ncbi:hypothetical protein EDD94_7610 [Streptomyces sp. PanSC9]|nr:hypothetical protein EDD94_7610 [Streptomyces sp. PanSC9]